MEKCILTDFHDDKFSKDEAVLWMAVLVDTFTIFLSYRVRKLKKKVAKLLAMILCYLSTGYFISYAHLL